VPDREQRELLLPRLELLDGLAAVLDRRDELMRVVGSAPSADLARTAVMATFELAEPQATAVLDLQVRRFAELDRHRILAERDEIRALLAADERR
jgi:DNA gyrase/topoisomerase IV subunit A